MFEKGWIQKRIEKKDGKGHPAFFYSMKIPFEKVINSIILENISEISRIRNNIEQLKRMKYMINPR